MEGARWHLLSQVFSSSKGMATDLDREKLIQETMDKDLKCRVFSWKVLRQAGLAMGATTYIRDTALTVTPFFDNAIRGGTILWGAMASGLRVIRWTGLSPEDQADTLLTLLNTKNWISFDLAGKTEPETTLFLIEGSIRITTTKGKAFRKMKWWQSGDDDDVAREFWSGEAANTTLLSIY